MGDKKENGLGGADLGSYDGVDIFGLDEFGAPVGIGPLVGAAIGVGAGTLTAIGVRNLTTAGAHSELIGMGVGIGAGAIMIAMGENTRHAGWVAVASAALNNGLRAIEQYFASQPGSPATHGMGITQIERRRAPLGMTQIESRRRPGGLGAAHHGAQLYGPPRINKSAGHWGASPSLMVPQA